MITRTAWIPPAQTEEIRRTGFIVMPFGDKAGVTREAAIQQAQQLLGAGHASVGIYRLSLIIEKDCTDGTDSDRT